VLRMEWRAAALAGERLYSRLRHLSRLVGRDAVILS
jgi:hypothetical protein